MNQRELLGYVVAAFERLAIPYMVVGSFASYAYGEPRFTQDLDIVLDLLPGTIPAFCAAFPAPEFYVSEAAVRDAVRTRFQFNILHPTSGNKIDCMFPGANEWARTQLSRRRRLKILSDLDASVASAEDVILGKLWYYSEGGSEKHLRDIAGILKRSGASVDRSQIAAWAERLGYSSIWNTVLEKLDG